KTWTPEHREKILADLPLGRMGTSEDIANCILFLASSLSDYVNGESLLANGGRYMQ
ncbi:MAG: SDR family oxidoreductase, partial [Erysipelotrichia bacterium]|nr:SDR family oxidoreductase [Erysipelotrichia bacterium]